MTSPHDDRGPGGAGRRRIAPAVTPLALTALAAASLAACDTGDGKSLAPPAVAFTTTVPPPATLLSVPIESDPLPTLPGAEPSIGSGDGTLQPFQIFVPWQDGGEIDERYGCDGDDVAPAVSWSSPPDGTAELAIAFIDESATDGDGPFVHWVLAGIDPADVPVHEGEVPQGAVQATNSFGTVGYAGPCPPAGSDPHVYRLVVYALNQQSELADGTPASNLLEFIEDVAIGSASLTGTARR